MNTPGQLGKFSRRKIFTHIICCDSNLCLENGEIESSGNIKDDVWEGEFTYHHKEKEEGYYISILKQGMKDGWNIKFKEDGTEDFRVCFQEDKEVRLDLCG